MQRTDETQVPALKLAAWRQETMSEKWVTRLTSVVDNAPKTMKNSSGLRSAGSHLFDNRRVTQVTSEVDNAMKTKKRKFAARVFRALSTTEEEDITCGHTLTWKMNDHLDDVTVEHCSTVTSSRSIIFSIKRTATLAQTLALYKGL